MTSDHLTWGMIQNTCIQLGPQGLQAIDVAGDGLQDPSENLLDVLKVAIWHTVD